MLSRLLFPGLLVLIIFIGIIAAIQLRILSFNQQKTREITSLHQELTGAKQTPKVKIIGWIPYWDQKRATESFKEKYQAFDYISFFWYYLDPNGIVQKYNSANEDLEIINFAKDNKIKVLAVVTNLPDYNDGGEWDWRRVDRVINNENSRTAHINELINLIEKKDFDGIDIDYEALKISQKENFTLFIEELAEELHQRGKILGVAIHPKTSEDNPQEDNGAHAQDLARISKVVDQMYFMTYTEHSFPSDPGPAGSIDWIKRVMSYAIESVRVPTEKIFLGIGLFGLEWHQSDNGLFVGVEDDLTFKQVQSIIKNNAVEVIWDDGVKSSHFEYGNTGERHVVWFENAQSVSARIDLVKELEVAGVAFWRLGAEDAGIWEGLRKP